MIGYTQGFVTRARAGRGTVLTRLNSMVDTANANLVNSRVSGQIRLVHTMQVSYTDTNTNDARWGSSPVTTPIRSRKPRRTRLRALRAAH